MSRETVQIVEKASLFRKVHAAKTPQAWPFLLSMECEPDDFTDAGAANRRRSCTVKLGFVKVLSGWIFLCFNGFPAAGAASAQLWAK